MRTWGERGCSNVRLLREANLRFSESSVLRSPRANWVRLSDDINHAKGNRCDLRQDMMARGTRTTRESPVGEEKKALASKSEADSVIDTPETSPKERDRRGKLISDEALNPVLAFMADTVHRARKEKKLTQHQLAARCGFNSTSIFMLESGKQNMTLKSLIAVAAALDMQVGDLFPRTATTLPPTTPSPAAAIETTVAKENAKLHEISEIVADVSRRMAVHLRTLDRISLDLQQGAKD
jgi:transcriptional regulator with XRE-family HTH domain